MDSLLTSKKEVLQYPLVVLVLDGIIKQPRGPLFIVCFCEFRRNHSHENKFYVLIRRSILN